MSFWSLGGFCHEHLSGEQIFDHPLRAGEGGRGQAHHGYQPAPWRAGSGDQGLHRALGRIMVELNALAEAGVLDDLAEFMAVTYGRPE